MSIRTGLGIMVLGMGLSAAAQVAPTVTTLPATSVGATSAVLNASFTVGLAQHLQNPGFEEALGPGNWNSTQLVRLDGETAPTTAVFDRVTGYDRPGNMGRLRYGTSTPGWVGLACEQRLNVSVPEGMPLVLRYLIRIQYVTGTDSVSDHGGLVEVEISAGGTSYRLRYYHRWKGALPPNAPRLHHMDVGKPVWQTWTSYERQLTADLSAAFGLSAFTVTAVRLGILMNRQGGTPVIHWLFDDVELRRGGVVVWHQYRRADEPTWQDMSWVTYTADGPHAATATGLTPGGRYRHRAALAYEGGVIYGAELEFQTIQVYTVQVSAEPPAGGTVGGGGTYTHGTSVTVTATPNAGYEFVNWTENGNVVSTVPNYTFTVTSHRNLVANFQLITYTVTVSASPAAGGTVSGGGTYPHGALATVTAAANPRYRFLNWTEGGVEVSTASSFAFTVTSDRTLVASFLRLGDVNLDGTVDVRDVRIIHQAALGLVTLTPLQRLAADVNGDGMITVADAERVAAWIVECP